ncbi:MAG: hypothetical protein ACOYB3_05555 [Azonexus sp.]
MTTNAELLQKLLERRAERMTLGLPKKLPGLPDGALLDMLGGAYREGYIVDFEAMAAELTRRLRAKRASSQAVAGPGQQDDGVRS